MAKQLQVRERKLASGEIEDMEHSDLYSDTTSITATSHASSNASKYESLICQKLNFRHFALLFKI